MTCLLCQRSDETEETGALSSKDNVVAHQNCLLFASGLYCVNTPDFDDLFGFSVEDVLEEVKRGKKLVCNKCKKKGATAGCEQVRCKKSYHFPCAVEDGAKANEDAPNGLFALYCPKHFSKAKGNGFSTRGENPLPQTSQTPCQAETSKKRSADSANQLEPRAKRSLQDSSDSDEEDILSMFAPLEFDIDEESQEAEPRKATGSTGSGSRTASTDATSHRLCLAMATDVRTHAGVTTETAVVVNNDEPRPEPSPVHGPGPHPAAAPDHAEAPGDSTSLSRPVSPPPVTSVPAAVAPEFRIDSASFWKDCNEAGCTKAIFSGFIQEMNDIAARVESGQASQEDYDLALLVMEASGKLVNLVAKQNEEMQRKQMEVCKAAACMKKVLSALKR